MTVHVKPIRWGILGTGGIAHKFAQGLQWAPGAVLAAVGSRDPSTADAFAREFNVPHAYGSYSELAQSPEVDVIYVSTPHFFHYENSLLCLENGKAVLCEKAFTINAREAQAVIDYARQKGLFVMEAMWTRFLPVAVRLRRMVAEGLLGELHSLAARFTFRADYNPQGRLFNPALGGGALLDVGVYPIAWAAMLFGEPTEIHGIAHLSDQGVDERATMLLGYAGGQTASLFASLTTVSPDRSTLMGSQGYLTLHGRLAHPTRITLSLKNKPDEELDVSFEGNGYQFEALHVMECLRQGKLESEIMSLDETLSIMRTMDQLRQQMGVFYPGETA
ncbi:MAG: Gfo/Idh/MocA family oxidoreductase [Anaerolineaceae bacterium]|nr:Gfo/Idh/MocA family oxidoreductase [Anaerolineaceae bacterium]